MASLTVVGVSCENFPYTLPLSVILLNHYLLRWNLFKEKMMNQIRLTQYKCMRNSLRKNISFPKKERKEIGNEMQYLLNFHFLALYFYIHYFYYTCIYNIYVYYHLNLFTYLNLFGCLDGFDK